MMSEHNGEIKVQIPLLSDRCSPSWMGTATLCFMKMSWNHVTDGMAELLSGISVWEGAAHKTSGHDDLGHGLI